MNSNYRLRPAGFGQKAINRIFCDQHRDCVEDYYADGYKFVSCHAVEVECDECRAYREQTAAELNANTQ